MIIDINAVARRDGGLHIPHDRFHISAVVRQHMDFNRLLKFGENNMCGVNAI
ncbi:hypothetical protein SDC9_138708 [bioreactor metagenome]|uniref:Uncharacterized protein n=1 Tax=bioreactor metagenome TaxID=1076179 RepID=A0A645DQH3_9ZZZZ